MTENTQQDTDPGATETTTPAAGKPDPFAVDFFLALLIENANVYGISTGITLCVGGLIVSGELISTEEYFRAFGEQTDVAVSTSLGEEPSGKYAEPYVLGAEAAKRAWDEKRANPDAAMPVANFICLQNVRLFNPSGDSIPNQDGIYWRGRLSAVDGFTLGVLTPADRSR